DRPHLRRRHPALRPARFRRSWVPHQGNARARHAALPVQRLRRADRSRPAPRRRGRSRNGAAATSKINDVTRRELLRRNGATDAEVEFLLEERVELNAMASDDLVEMVESKLEACGLEKVVPDDDLLGKTYKEFHRSNELREKFEEMAEDFEET